MKLRYNIALLIPMYEHEQRLLGHLWHRPTKNSMPLHWGQQYAELDEVIREQAFVHNIGTHKFTTSSNLDKKKSLGILSGILKAFGAAGISLSSLTKKNFSLEVDLTDYVRPSLPRAVLSRLTGKPLPTESLKGGHWFACYAQHQATKGTINLKYSRSSSFDLAAKLKEKGDHKLTLEDNSSKEQLFSFTADRPLVFGVSLQHLWESGGKIGRFGDEHEGINYVGV